jgi:hypothetical protein
MNHDLSLRFKALEIRVELENPVKPTKKLYNTKNIMNDPYLVISLILLILDDK